MSNGGGDMLTLKHELENAEEANIANPDAIEPEVSGNAKIISKYEGNSVALSCSVFQESNLVAVGSSTGLIEIRTTDELQEICKMQSSNNMPVTSLSGFTSNDNRQLLLASYGSGETIMWNAEEGAALWTIREDRQALVNDFNCDYTWFAVGGSDSKISVYDIGGQIPMQVLQGSMDPDVMDGHNMRVFSVRFHPSRRHVVVTGGWDNTVQFWDIREPFSRRKIRGPHICGKGIEFIGNDKIVTASWRKYDPLQIWDYGSGKLIETIKPDDWTCFLYCCRYVEPESIILTGGSHKNMLRVIDFSSYHSTATFRSLPGAVCFVKELPKSDPFSYTRNICFCSDSTVYVAEVEA